jgi:hypothetical protein
MRSPSLLLQAALEYAARGWRVVPLHTPTAEPERPCSCGAPLDEEGRPTCAVGKHPRLREWPRQAATDEDQIRQWWDMWPEANIGIACGEGSGWFALDVDGPVGEATLARYEAANSPLPATPEQITGSGGRHRLFAYEPGLTNAVKFAPGLDLRTDGGLIVVEPSLHASGKEYLWDPNAHPSEVAIPPAPRWLIAAIKKAGAKGTGLAPVLGDEIPQGERDSALTSVAGSMRRRGAAAAEIEAALAVMNRNRCRPPLPEAEVRKIAMSVGRYEPAAQNGAEPAAAVPVHEREWEPVVDLFESELPAFPVHVLPVWLAAQVFAVSEATQTPVDLAAMIGLATLALACQKRVEVWVRPDWTEPANLWTVAAMGSGEAKTPVFNHMIAPVVAYEAELAESMRDEVARNRTEREILEGRIKRLQGQAAREENLFDRGALTREATTLASELAHLPPMASPRFLADDATPESLALVMSEQGERVAIMADEAGVFEIMAGRYTSGRTNFTFYLKAHSGSMHIIDRITRPSVTLRRPALSMGLTCQPEVLVRLSENPEFRERGLLARFLYAVPKSRVGARNTDAAPLAAGIAQKYAERLRPLLELPAARDDNGRPLPHTLLLSDLAFELFMTFRRALEPELGEHGRLGLISDWGNKLPGTVARIAGLLHMAEGSGEARPWEQRIQEESVAGSVQIAEYLIRHALAAFRMIGSDPNIPLARKIIRWLTHHRISRITRRDLFRGMQGTFDSVEEIDPPLTMLMDYHYLRQLPSEERRGPGQQPSPIFAVNPMVVNETSDNG